MAGVSGETLHVFWTRVGDAPEHLLHSTIDVGDDWATADWSAWRASPPESLLAPETEWEGADLPIEPSARGQATRRPWCSRPSQDPVSNQRFVGKPSAPRLVLPTTTPSTSTANSRFHESTVVVARERQ